MRKLTVLLAVLMLCLQVFSGTVVFGAKIEEGDNIRIVDSNSDTGTIREGRPFELTVFIGHKSEKVLKNIEVDIDESSDFYGDPKMTEFYYLEELTKDDERQALKFLTNHKLVYKGSGNSLKLNFTYYIGEEKYTESHILSVTEAVSKDSEQKPPGKSDPNLSEYKPNLTVDNSGKIPIIPAGSSYRLKFNVKNLSGHQAKNVKVSLVMADSEKAPLVLENFDLRQTVASIEGNSTKDIIFDIKTNKTSPQGVFPLALKFEYSNAYNIEFPEQSETVYIKIENNNISPKLIVDGISLKPSAISEEAVTLELVLKNLGDLKADDVKVTLQGLKSGGFIAHNSTDVKYVNSIGGKGTATVSYELLPPASGAAASNELSVKLEYKDAIGTAYSDQNQVFVPVGEGEGSRPNLTFEKIVSPQNAVTPGQEFTVGLDLINSGGAIAKNVKVTLAADAGIVARSMNPVYLMELDGAKAEKISFKLFASDDTPTKNYPIALNVEYEDTFGTKYNASQYIGVFIENDAGKTVPRIIIDNYSMDPFPVNAGEDFNLKMSFLNTSKTVDVSNIKVTVSSEDGTFTPTDSGNTFYIESIPRTKNVERELLLHVKPDAEQKSYILNVDFEYEDEKGNPYTAKETMSARVVQNPRLVTGDLNLMPETFVGQPVWVYLDFYNMGKSTLFNLMVSIEGDFQGQGLNYYVGNFEPGRTDYIDVSFSAMNPGQQKGSVLFAFEDANGVKTEIRKEFELNVMEMMQEGPMLDENGMPIDGGGFDESWGGGKPMPGMPGMPGEPQQKSIWLYVGIGAGVLIVAIVLIIILRKRHVRRKELSLDE